MQRLGAGQRRPVEQGRGIALAEAADIDEATFDDRQAGDAGQGFGGVGVARASQVFGGQEGRDFRAFAVRLGDVAAEDDDLVELRRLGPRDLAGAAGLRTAAV